MAAWDGKERRRNREDRRQGRDRRRHSERRQDHRLASGGRRLPLFCRLRSLTRPRLGVDRRKGGDRRQAPVDRRRQPSSILSPEEIAALLED